MFKALPLIILNIFQILSRLACLDKRPIKNERFFFCVPFLWIWNIIFLLITIICFSSLSVSYNKSQIIFFAQDTRMLRPTINPPTIMDTHGTNSQELIDKIISQSHSNRTRHTENHFSRCLSFGTADRNILDDDSSGLDEVIYSQEIPNHQEII